MTAVICPMPGVGLGPGICQLEAGKKGLGLCRRVANTHDRICTVSDKKDRGMDQGFRLPPVALIIMHEGSHTCAHMNACMPRYLHVNRIPCRFVHSLYVHGFAGLCTDACNLHRYVLHMRSLPHVTLCRSYLGFHICRAR